MRNNNATIICNGQVVECGRLTIQDNLDPGSNPRFAIHFFLKLRYNK